VSDAGTCPDATIAAVTTPAWYPDERAHAGPEHLDPAYVATYERKAGLDAQDELSLLREHGLGAETTLVDLGCGTGLLALAAASHCRRVVAVDPSPAMVAVVRGRSVGVPNVEIVQAGFLTYDHRGEPPQLVHSRNALHHLPDFWKALALGRIRDLLAPGGVLVLRDLVYPFAPQDAAAELELWFAGAAATPAEGWTRAELEEHVRSEHSTFTWLLEPLLERAGFAIRAVERRGVYATYVCAAP
jgi:SAM-dependent methyltransferase